MWSNISSSSSSPSKSLKTDQQVKQELVCSNESSVFSNNEINNSNNNNKDHCGSPLMRYKHAVCSAPSGYIYIHGGRFGNLPLDDDIWRFDPHQNTWLQLQTKGCKPPSLQEHTLVEYNEQLYLFGGQVSASNNENSFWRLDLVNSEWHSLSMKSSKFGAHLGPTNRRGHSAIIYGDSMYIYGGFEDFRGSSAQLWQFDLLSQRWELSNLSSTSACHPEPRHSHSAIVYEDSMYVYGGLSNLKPLSDLWRWSWRDKRWFKERTRGNSPGRLHGHTAIQAFGSMFVFGGERNGRTTRSLWRLNLSNMTWQKIRPKGPRPSPTTWHGAIANPLSILDETNYIIEGDPDLLLKNSSLSESNCFSLYNGASSRMQPNQQEVVGVRPTNCMRQSEPKVNPTTSSTMLTHSKSSNADVSKLGAKSSLLAHQNSDSRLKRKSRLSFLRRCRHDRPRSTYELKQIHNSVSATNFVPPNTINSSSSRHSLSGVTAPSTLRQTSGSGGEPPPAALLSNSSAAGETNVKILDNLDTDIKEMFQRAMSPDDDDNVDEPMSVDTTTQLSESAGVTNMTSRQSQYQTAIQADSTMTDLNFRSQRTSYAYTTPPSELNTLRDLKVAESQHLTSQAALLGSSTSGYDRRYNRPKSEIVQSLIDRADARIKHLYTPFFQHSNELADKQHPDKNHNNNRASDRARNNGGRHSYNQQKNRHSLTTTTTTDKSKRHTIHQTMTYYNLYFSEDKSSNSSPPSDTNQAQSHEEEEEQKVVDGYDRMKRHLTRDDISSDTIKGSNTLDRFGAVTTSGTLVGIRGGSQISDHQDSQLSLEGSDTKTLCGGDNTTTTTTTNTTPPGGDVSTGGGSGLFLGSNSLQSSSMANALTGRRDTAESSCDNTSLSFSVIAEFEEDDMLQYSSPTDPSVIIDHCTHNLFDDENNSSSYRRHQSINEHNTFAINDERESKLIVSMELGSTYTNQQQQQTMQDERGCQQQATTDYQEDGHRHDDNKKLLVAHKSASSGYDSISGGCEQSSNRAQESSSSSLHPRDISGDSSNHQRCTTTSNTSDTQEDSSVRTESSLGFNTTTETSPEQSAMKNQHKKMRPILYPRKVKDSNRRANTTLTTTTTSTTADSLAALTSDGYESSSIANCQPPNKTIMSSSSGEKEESSSASFNHEKNHQLQSMSHLSTQTKMPLMSRSKFFSKQKSKNRYWQLCMFVIGGKQGGSHGGVNEPITIWRLYI